MALISFHRVEGAARHEELVDLTLKAAVQLQRAFDITLNIFFQVSSEDRNL